MNSKHLAALALAIGGTLAAGAAHAGGRADVQWSVTFGSPHLGVVVGAPAYAPAYAPIDAPIYATTYAPRAHGPYVVVPRGHYQPVAVAPRRGADRARWRDADRDGIPDRRDRVYNPRWDRDGDGIPNRRDPRPNRPGR